MSQEPPEFSPAWFDAASAAWLENKRKIRGGSYRYICEHRHSAWRKCRRDVYKTQPYCRQHYALNNNAQFKAAMAGRNAVPKPEPEAAVKPKPESPTYD